MKIRTAAEGYDELNDHRAEFRIVSADTRDGAQQVVEFDEHESGWAFLTAGGRTYQVSVTAAGVLQVRSFAPDENLAIVPQAAHYVEIVATDVRVKRLTRRSR